MKFCKPNIPQNKVESVFISQIMPDDMRKNLTSHGIDTMFAPVCKSLTTELAFHPDIVLNNPKTGIWFSGAETNMNKLLTKGDSIIGDKYPDDCKYNCFIIEDILYGGKSAAPEITKFSKKHICVAQGYTKCSTVILSENDFITSDPSIYKALNSEEKNVLKVSNDGILLNGFSCGFIGGCTGVLGNKTLAVTGNARLLGDYEKISGFCKNIGYSIISLSNCQPYDYGGILPVTEE